VRLIEELRRYTLLGFQELKSLTSTERRRILDGEERIQRFIEDVISYGVEKGAFPPGNIDLKAHCLLILAQSWAVRHWALKRFTKVEDYLSGLKEIVLQVVESKTPQPNGVAMILPDAMAKVVAQRQDSLS
jgi:hypothetical protein